eukprot:2373825-Prymnesium_polylepis.1
MHPTRLAARAIRTGRYPSVSHVFACAPHAQSFAPSKRVLSVLFHEHSSRLLLQAGEAVKLHSIKLLWPQRAMRRQKRSFVV